MTATEMKLEIQKVLDKVPEETLPNILNFLKDLQPDSISTLTPHLKKILEEDKELLQKLA